jgi:hypothetical protein
MKVGTRGPALFQHEQAAHQKVSQLWHSFQTFITAQVNEQLTLNGLADGEEVLIEITPVSVEAYFGKNEGISQKFLVRTSINDPESNCELWYATISVLQDF